ncbi:hypothetical protein HPB51_002281 [Rhipicephalus microplus]|uniref:Uncharacterized protein n=1 Tax=Rhipicephalus microplus TaxID=6941 RepID=A0A9J6DY26_RHIMP|nr:hypothetical protein HPB51_002281 [Rhipicephalus microplus]
MTDNSTTEKAAVLELWREATRLLCHPHVAPAEWCWLHASSNKISRDEKRELMTAFQKVMYESLVEDLETATEDCCRSLSAGTSSTSPCLMDAAEVLKQLHEEEWRFYSLAADNPHYTALEQVLAEMKKVHKEPQVMASYFAQKAAFASARRRGRLIKVQPTGIARL